MLDNVHEALRQVGELRGQLLRSHLFRGYSGVARMLGGILAVIGALILSSPLTPPTVTAHVVGWGAICAAAFALNYGALMLWFYRNSGEPYPKEAVIDPMPALLAGGVLTFALLARGAFDLLFGTWMLLYGVANLSARRLLPREVAMVGWFYIAAGTMMVSFVPPHFLNPWPMGLTFFVGELLGGFAFKRAQEGKF